MTLSLLPGNIVMNSMAYICRLSYPGRMLPLFRLDVTGCLRRYCHDKVCHMPGVFRFCHPRCFGTLVRGAASNSLQNILLRIEYGRCPAVIISGHGAAASLGTAPQLLDVSSSNQHNCHDKVCRMPGVFRPHRVLHGRKLQG